MNLAILAQIISLLNSLMQNYYSIIRFKSTSIFPQSWPCVYLFLHHTLGFNLKLVATDHKVSFFYKENLRFLHNSLGLSRTNKYCTTTRMHLRKLVHVKNQTQDWVDHLRQCGPEGGIGWERYLKQNYVNLFISCVWYFTLTLPFWSQAIMLVSTPRKYPSIKYFLVPMY